MCIFSFAFKTYIKPNIFKEINIKRKNIVDLKNWEGNDLANVQKD